MVTCPHIQVSAVEVSGVTEAKGEEAGEATEQLERLLFILHTLVSHRDGAKITKPEAVCQVGATHEYPLDFPERCFFVLFCFSQPSTFSSPQTVVRLCQSSSLSPSCSRLLLQITSSLLLGENVSLPKALIQETVQKV